MAIAPEKIETLELCSYGCDNKATHRYKNGKYCCSDNKNKCSSIRKKNSDGINKNGVWNKGLNKNIDERVLKYSISGKETRIKQVEKGEFIPWNKGLDINDDRVYNNIKDLSKNRKNYYHTLKYFVDKMGIVEGEKAYLKLNKLKSLTLENFIRKHGEVNGLKEYLKKFSKDGLKYYSKISQEMFNSIIENIDIKFNKVYYLEENKEYGIKYYNKYYFYDFVILDNHKIIEFNGDVWHANPLLYDNNNKPFCYKNVDLNEVWDYEDIKIKAAKRRGFEVLVVWENEYKNNKEETINKCINFLKNEKR